MSELLDLEMNVRGRINAASDALNRALELVNENSPLNIEDIAMQLDSTDEDLRQARTSMQDIRGLKD